MRFTDKKESGVLFPYKNQFSPLWGCCPPPLRIRKSGNVPSALFAPDNPLLWRLTSRRFRSIPWPLPTGVPAAHSPLPPLVTTQNICRFVICSLAGKITPGWKPLMLLNTDWVLVMEYKKEKDHLNVGQQIEETMVHPYPASICPITAVDILYNVLRCKTNVTTGASNVIPVLRTENNVYYRVSLGCVYVCKSGKLSQNAYSTYLWWKELTHGFSPFFAFPPIF